MPDLKQFLTDEIRRLARKEIKLAVAPLHETISAQRKALAAQNKRIAALEKQLGVLAPASAKTTEPAAEETAAKKVRLTPQKIAAIRKNLGLSQKEFAVLLDSSIFSVCHWESGKVAPREKQKQKIAAFRHVGKRELAKLIAEKLPDHKAKKLDKKA